jgi:hydroxyacylglutathione hydrolase
MALDDSTQVYCAHEYTAANAAFARTIEKTTADDASNSALASRLAEIASLRARDLPTVPTTIGQERRTNPFVRPEAVRAALKLPAETSDAEVFATVRRMKDHF